MNEVFKCVCFGIRVATKVVDREKVKGLSNTSDEKRFSICATFTGFNELARPKICIDTALESLGFGL